MVPWYLICLLVAVVGLILVDRRFRLYFWDSPGRAAIVTLIGIAFFTVWDAAGIGLGIFLRGDSPAYLGWDLAPEFPVEELLFLTFLCYLTMLLVLGSHRVLADRRRQ